MGITQYTCIQARTDWLSKQAELDAASTAARDEATTVVLLRPISPRPTRGSIQATRRHPWRQCNPRYRRDSTSQLGFVGMPWPFHSSTCSRLVTALLLSRCRNLNLRRRELARPGQG